MFKGEWQGSNVPKDNRILVLGESHYGDEILDADLTTAGVIQTYLKDNKNNTRKNWAQFFDKIAGSFGYEKEQAEDFYSQIYFGNYIEKLCGIKENNPAATLVKENQVAYNNSLFDFVNRNQIKVIVCFSILAFDHMPSRGEGEKATRNTCIGNVGGKNDVGREYLYLPGVKHDRCEVELNDQLLVLAVRHPSASGGFSMENVKGYLQGYDAIKSIIR